MKLAKFIPLTDSEAIGKLAYDVSVLSDEVVFELQSIEGLLNAMMSHLEEFYRIDKREAAGLAVLIDLLNKTTNKALRIENGIEQLRKTLKEVEDESIK